MSPIRSCSKAVSLACVLLLGGVVQAQIEVTEEEKAIVVASAEELVELSVRPELVGEATARLRRHLSMRSAMWLKKGADIVAVASGEVYAEFSVPMKSLIAFQFKAPTVPDATEPLTEQEASVIASRIIGAQMRGNWVGSQPVAESMGTAVRFTIYPLFEGTRLAAARARVIVDLYSGAVIQFDSTYRWLPRVGQGEGVEQTPALREELFQAALSAYSRWRPLSSATIAGSGFSYEVPAYEHYPNEMTQEHVSLRQQGLAMLKFHVALRGWRDGERFNVAIYVDASTKRAVAIREVPLSLVSLSFGQARDFGSTFSASEGVQVASLLNGKHVSLKPVSSPDTLESHASTIFRFDDGGVVTMNVDTLKRVLWFRTGPANEITAFSTEDAEWQLILGLATSEHKPFGSKKLECDLATATGVLPVSRVK